MNRSTTLALVASLPLLGACSLLEDFDQYTSGGAAGSSQATAGAAGAVQSGGKAGSGGSIGGSGGSSGSSAGMTSQGGASAGMTSQGGAGQGGMVATGGGGTGGVAGGAGGAQGGSSGKGGSPGTGNVGREGEACPSPNKTSCAGNAQKTVLICDVQTMTWRTLQVCSAGEFCDSGMGPNSGSCAPIVPVCDGQKPGAVVCDAEKRVSCGDDLVTVDMLDTCKSAAHCAQGSGDKCAACTDGEHACEGATLQVCKPTRDGFSTQETCASAALCDAPNALCNAPACSMGQHKCDGDNLQICLDDLTGFTGKEVCAPGTCLEAAGKCGACVANTSVCVNETTKQTCDQSGQSQVSACPAQTPKCIGDGTCVQCTVDLDCPAPATPCQSRVCFGDNTCGFAPNPAPPALSDAPGNCQKLVCSNGQEVSQNDPTDTPAADSDECTYDTCVDNGSGTLIPDHPTKIDGASCSTGACVSGQCVKGASCSASCSLDNCCASAAVEAGSFGRSYDASNTSAGVSGWQANENVAPATLDPFTLDVYEVSVGRFRRFFDAYPESIPLPGAGADPTSGFSGWKDSWTAALPTTKSALSAKLVGGACASGAPTWYEGPLNENEERPISCTNWYLALAFCIWDGGRLATEAQWNYAAAGGSQQRAFPWSSPASSLTIGFSNASYAATTNKCDFDGSSLCEVTDLAKIGQLTAGTGRWGHRDLSGNLREWVLDSISGVSSTYNITNCNNCGYFDETDLQGNDLDRIIRGGSYLQAAVRQRSANRDRGPAGPFQNDVGIRCVR